MRKLLSKLFGKRKKQQPPRVRLALLTIEQIKQHSRYDFNNDEPRMVAYALRAETVTQQILGKTFFDIEQEFGEIPSSIRYACLILCGNYFEEDYFGIPQRLRRIPNTIGMLLKPYAKDGIMERIEKLNANTIV